MNLCSEGHDEICYEGRNCPLCEKIEEIKAYEEQIDDLFVQIDKLKEAG
jgi:hypothetical protein